MIKHTFAQEPEALKLFDGVTKFSQFKSRLKKLSQSLQKSNPVRWGRYADQRKNEYKILGDGFELFCELLVMHMGFHPHIGLTNYDPIEEDQDEGVDAYAFNIENQKSAVQCKFISDPTYEFTANGSNLVNFLVEANFNNIEFKDRKIKRLFLFTTASGLHYHTQKKWRDSVHVINNKIIELLTDNNTIFWNSCLAVIKESQNG